MSLIILLLDGGKREVGVRLPWDDNSKVVVFVQYIQFLEANMLLSGTLYNKSWTSIGLIQVKEEGRTGFSKG